MMLHGSGSFSQDPVLEICGNGRSVQLFLQILYIDFLGQERQSEVTLWVSSHFLCSGLTEHTSVGRVQGTLIVTEAGIVDGELFMSSPSMVTTTIWRSWKAKKLYVKTVCESGLGAKPLALAH